MKFITKTIKQLRLRHRIKMLNTILESNSKFFKKIDEEIDKRRNQRDTLEKSVALAESVGRSSRGNLKVLAGVQTSFLSEAMDDSRLRQRIWLETFEKEAVIRTEMLKESYAAVKKLEGKE